MSCLILIGLFIYAIFSGTYMILYLLVIYAIFFHKPDISRECRWFKENDKKKFNGLD